MTAIVRTFYLSSFNMPGKCVSCGEASDPEFKWKVSWGQLEKDKITLSVDFPMCSKCGNDIKLKSKGIAKFIKIVFVLLSPIACWFTSMAVNTYKTGVGYIGLIAGAVALVLMILLGSWVSDLIDTAGFTPDQKQVWKQEKKTRKEQKKKLEKCAKIAKIKLPSLLNLSDNGYIDFEFENMLFAMEFATLNLGQLTNK